MKAMLTLLAILFSTTHTLSQQLKLTVPNKEKMPKLSAFTGRPGTLVAPLPCDFYAKHIGFFCRQELKMQQARIPVSFRLGSMEYCNKLEQKPGYK
jgi:hypothetical protein